MSEIPYLKPKARATAPPDSHTLRYHCDANDDFLAVSLRVLQMRQYPRLLYPYVLISKFHSAQALIIMSLLSKKDIVCMTKQQTDDQCVLEHLILSRKANIMHWVLCTHSYPLSTHQMNKLLDFWYFTKTIWELMLWQVKKLQNYLKFSRHFSEREFLDIIFPEMITPYSHSANIWKKPLLLLGVMRPFLLHGLVSLHVFSVCTKVVVMGQEKTLSLGIFYLLKQCLQNICFVDLVTPVLGMLNMKQSFLL